jgi:hypothetical protein
MVRHDPRVQSGVPAMTTGLAIIGLFVTVLALASRLHEVRERFRAQLREVERERDAYAVILTAIRLAEPERRPEQ